MKDAKDTAPPKPADPWVLVETKPDWKVAEVERLGIEPEVKWEGFLEGLDR
jgi:hypothetical protein